MITPPFLEPGNRIALFAPARSGDEPMIQAFGELLASHGFELVRGKCLSGRNGQFSGSDAERSRDLISLWEDPGIHALMALRGGYGTARLVESLPFDTFKKQPKWLMGFSDLTVLLAALNRHSSLETLHSWMPVSLTTEPPIGQSSIASLFEALTGRDLQYNFEPHALNVQGEAHGRLTGGNLSVLYSLAGTPWEPDYDGKILFLEDLDEYLYHIDRMCMNFALRGIFERISGLVVGTMSDMHDNAVPFGKNAEEIIAGYAERYGVPTVFGFPSGHKSSNQTLIMGREVTLSSGSKGCQLRFSPAV